MRTVIKSRQKKVLNVIISGGGPIGLSFALLLERLMGERVKISVYDGRWVKKNTQIVWRSGESGNSRRQQVVTLQSRQYLQYPKDIRNKIFKEEKYSTMWPEGPDCIKGYPPYNVRIEHIENTLLEIANEKQKNIKLIPHWFKAKEQHEDLIDHQILAICEGGNSRTRDFFIDRFGEANKSMYSLNGEHLQDVTLGIRVKSELSNPMSLLLNVVQNRFLLNTLDGDGFLNMRLADDEVKNVVGIDPNNPKDGLKTCIQSQPCLMETTPESDDLSCLRHGTIFFPSLLEKRSPLWIRIQEGLKLFGVKPENLSAVTTFQLSIVQRPRFTTQLYPTTQQTSGTFGFLLGDAANAIHFWSGRGLNNGISSAVSLARCLNEKWRGNLLREADFTRHEGIMSMLQYRHQNRGWQMMVDTDSEGKTYAIKDKIAWGIKESEQDHLNKEADIVVLMRRLREMRERLATRIGGFPDDKQLHKHLQRLDAKTLKMLVVSDMPNTKKIGGEEVNVDLLFNEPEFSRVTPLLGSLIYEKGGNDLLPPKLEIKKATKCIKIGRNKEWCDFYLQDLSVSRHHSELIHEHRALFIKDAQSLGGTYLNGKKLKLGDKKLLEHNDRVGFGEEITYKVEILN